MLYQVYETQRTLMEPFVDFAQAAAKLYSSSSSPIAQNPFVQRMAAGYELIYRLGKDYERPVFGIQSIVNGEVARGCPCKAVFVSRARPQRVERRQDGLDRRAAVGSRVQRQRRESATTQILLLML